MSHAAAAIAGLLSLGLAQTFNGQVSPAAPLAIGETFTVASKTLGEVRRINVYVPPVYSGSANVRLPVLYMPDGGIGEDFLHIAGLLQVSIGNGTMRPFLLVGIENTERRRDLTGPTQSAEDRKIAPQVGGSARFREFIRSELMPAIRTRYRTTGETAIMGESLAGLFVVETFFVEPTLFDSYIAFDPSLWWNNEELLKGAGDRLRTLGRTSPRTLHLASSGERDLSRMTAQLADALQQHAPAHVQWHYDPMPEETHATIYHPAALWALRRWFEPQADPKTSVADAEDVWRAHEPRSYEFTIDVVCFCTGLARTPPRFRVNGGQSVPLGELDSVSMQTYSRYNSFDKLFALLRSVAEAAPFRMLVTYDDTMGYPTSIDIDRRSDVSDDELRIVVTNFRVIERR
jgi:predicted alpha/beta superfamily hydrolase